jgi:hypothetical protein
MCLGLALSVAGLCQAQDRQIRRDIRKGRIVRVNPQNHTIVLQSGTVGDVKEYEYRLAPETKYWAADRSVLHDGLKYRGFVPGTEIWYLPGSGTSPISEVWLGDPNLMANQVNPAPTYVEGKIVRVDPTNHIVVVRSNLGTEVKEFEYRVDPNTKYWGADQREFNNALNYQGFREGTPIWYSVGPGDRSRILNEIRFYDPTVKPIIRRR